jgi:NitT/TauT family transport system permease protein
MGVILLIFTGQVWNLAFSFYSSLKSIPREMLEASRIYRYSAWQRFWQLEMPLRRHRPGLELDRLGGRRMVRPDRLRDVHHGRTQLPVARPGQLSANRLQRPSVFTRVPARAWSALEENVCQHLSRSRECRIVQPIDDSASKGGRLLPILLGIFAGMAGIWGISRAFQIVHGVSWAEVHLLLMGAGATYLRVNLTLLIAAAWTVPVGVLIGLNPRLARFLQPVIQVVASIPATALFPVLLLGLIRLGGGLGIGSIALMLLGAQWYVLFNVIAGAIAIPSDLKEAAAVYKFNLWQRWTRLILPGIFPYLITGMITASGGAWNASIIAEYFHIGDKTLQTLGLGAQISAASDAGNFANLLLATVLMATMVVTMNRLVWRRLYRLAETRYKLES